MKLCCGCAVLGAVLGVAVIYIALMYGPDSLASL